MATHEDGPKFVSEGNRAYITVAKAKAEALRQYLRSKGVHTHVAEGAGDFVSVEIGGVFEAREIEQFLGEWNG